MLVEYIAILFRILRALILDGKELACEKLCGERGGRKLLRNYFFFFFTSNSRVFVIVNRINRSNPIAKCINGNE